MSIVAQTAPSDKSLSGGARRQQERELLSTDILSAIIPIVEDRFNSALNAEVTTYLGRTKGQHRRSLSATVSPLLCPVCARHATLDFVRNGHYERTLLAMWGGLHLAVPRVECACGHCPPIPFALLDRYDRLWSDLDATIIQCTALALSLRSVSAVLELPSGQVVSIGAVHRRVVAVAVLAAQEMKQPLADVPPVIMLDGLWGTFMADSGQRKLDKQGRLRKVKRRQTVPLLVAYGVDPQTGEKRLLAWVQGKAESTDDWERLLSTLHGRGVHYGAGLRLFVHDGSSGLEAALEMVDFGPVRHQRCIFHKLRNVIRDVLGNEGMSRAQKQERVTAVLKDACAVYEAPTAAQAQERAATFRVTWGEQEAKAVATLERDFEQTLIYYAVAAEAQVAGNTWLATYLRTTSGLERFNRGLRRKWRQAGAFWSEDGLMAAMWLVTQEGGRRDTTTRTGWLAPIIAQTLESG
jgi:transposase-like protein